MSDPENLPQSQSGETRLPPTPASPLKANMKRAQPVSPEILVGRLGDLMIEKGLISSAQLQRALDYQRANTIAGNPRLLGQVLIELGMTDRETLELIVTQQIESLHNALRESNRQLEQRVEQRTRDLERRLVQIRTAAEVAQIATSAKSLDELLRIAADMIVERLGYYYVSIFLLDEAGQFAVLREASGSIGQELKQRGYKLAIGSRSIVGWVAENNQPRIVSQVTEDPLYLQNELLPQTRSEACIPLSVGMFMLGVLDVQSLDTDAFPGEDVAVLQTLANQVASAIQNLRLLESAQISLQELNLLYRRSHEIARAVQPDQVLAFTAAALRETPYLSAILKPGDAGYQVAYFHDPLGSADFRGQAVSLEPDALNTFFTAERPYWISSETDEHQTLAGLSSLRRAWSCPEVACLPIQPAGRPAALALLGARGEQRLTSVILQPYLSLIELASTALAKLNALTSTQERLASLQVLNKVGQVIATETELSRLYTMIHEQITQVMGENNFYIALYDPRTNFIEFPYLYDDGRLTRLDPIPLGEGLTSIVIRTGQPLMLVEDTENKARALGARQVGKMAKSWLGVPLTVGNEIMGVMTVQNTEFEAAFDEEDMRLLSTLASQAAVAIRNAQLLNASRRQAERERMVLEITDRIRQSIDMQTILATTAVEVGKALGAQRATIRLRTPETPVDSAIAAAAEEAPAAPAGVGANEKEPNP
jgi:GAF domain-containing protein